MSIFQDATHVSISGGTLIASGIVHVNQSGQGVVSNAFKDLSAAAAHTALHNSVARFDAPRCHRNTRTSYLDALERWMLGLGGSYSVKRLIWLTGGAGAGKSAIMQSIVERCAKHAVILGAFFFSRTDSSRNQAEVLIPTLAYQLARAFPAAIDVLEPIILHDPLIFKASLQTQAYELLVQPLLYLIKTGAIDITSPLRRVFVIDGLDECSDSQKQALIIHAVATILQDNHAPVCFLISSRPEVAISRAFQRENHLRSIFAPITLDHDPEASSDIRQFIKDSFLDILDTHPSRTHIPFNWPKLSSVDRLVQNSSGHFIYAASAMKFISSTDEHPARALQVVEGLVPCRMGNPFAELDALYIHILTSAKHRSQVLGILRHCILTLMDNSVKAICFMYPNISPEDVTLFLYDMQALVSLSPGNSAEMHILLKHASLRDFLIAPTRSHRLYMSKEQYGALLLPRYFKLLDSGPQARSSSLHSKTGGDLQLLTDLYLAILHSQNIKLLQSLIYGHSPRDVWNYCLECWAQSENTTGDFQWALTLESVCRYVCVIRDSVANHGNTLYIRQLNLFVQMLMDDLDNQVKTTPHYRIVPALMFSSSASCLTILVPLLLDRFLGPQRYISRCYTAYFRHLRLRNTTKDVIDPRSYEALMSLPQTQSSWSSDLAYLLELVLQHLLGYSWTPECIHPNPHERWLNRTKPMKNMSLGSPKLSSNFYLYLRRLPRPLPQPRTHVLTKLERYGYSFNRVREISSRREECFVLLNAVIFYLHKCDCTSELAKLTRRSLPMAALWFPRLMKRARAKMDAYVLRWEESLDGFLERTQSLSINQVD